LIAENEIIRSCFEGSPQKDCTNTTCSFEICYCDSDLQCNLNRAAVTKTSPSSDLQWFHPSQFRCLFSLCGVGALPKSTPDPKMALDLLRELQHHRINVQLHFNFFIVYMMLIMLLLFCFRLLSYVLQKLQ